MKTRNLSAILLTLLFLVTTTALLTACSDDEENGTPEIHLSLSTDECQVMAGNVTTVPVTTHENSTVDVDNEDLISAKLVMQEYYGLSHNAYIRIEAKEQTGKTSIRITDKETNETATLTVTVTERYVAMEVNRSDHPTFQNNMVIFVKDNAAHDAVVYRPEIMECTDAKPKLHKIGHATYDFSIEQNEEDGLSLIMTLCYATDTEDQFTLAEIAPATHKFRFYGNEPTISALRYHLDTPLRQLSPEELQQLLKPYPDTSTHATRTSVAIKAMFAMCDSDTGHTIGGELLHSVSLPE